MMTAYIRKDLETLRMLRSALYKANTVVPVGSTVESGYCDEIAGPQTSLYEKTASSGYTDGPSSVGLTVFYCIRI